MCLNFGNNIISIRQNIKNIYFGFLLKINFWNFINYKKAKKLIDLQNIIHYSIFLNKNTK